VTGAGSILGPQHTDTAGAGSLGEHQELARIRQLSGLKEAEDIPEIKAANRQAAIAQARKQGIKRFRFCQKYRVTDAKKTKKKDKIAPHPIQQTRPDASGAGDMDSIANGNPNLNSSMPVSSMDAASNFLNQGRGR
jgi:hypothetical protein